MGTIAGCPASASAPPRSTPSPWIAPLARVLAERLQQVETYGGKCPSCGDAVARAFLARLRRLLEEMGG
jgi:hypothetical protein